MRLAISKCAAFVVIISVALAFLGAQSPALAANPSSGLTIITHGFQFSGGYLPNWASEMANAIKARTGADIRIYRVRYDKGQSSFSTDDDKIQLETGDCEDVTKSIDITSTGGAIILLDWAAASNSDDTLRYPAQDVADRFFGCLFDRGHNGHNLAELPIHLIGHSRGAILNTRLAYRLAEHGILVEQVTTLDPHAVRPWHFPSGNDWVPVTYSNVIFADNYYRTGAYPAGQSVAGAAEYNLTAKITGERGTTCPEHTQIHTYYHGTVARTAGYDGPTPPPDTEACKIYGTWYDPTSVRRETGYNFSRYTDHSVARPASGVNQFIAGGAGSRVEVTNTFQSWPNVGFDQRSINPPARVTVGQKYDIPYYYADRSSQQTITFFTDDDTNPFNGMRDFLSVTENSHAGVAISSKTFSWTPTAADVGTPRYIGAMTTNFPTDYRVRHDYYLDPIIVEAAPPPPPPTDTFPPGGLMPAGWVQPAGSTAPWVVATDSFYVGPKSLKSGTITHSQFSKLATSGAFLAGNVSFALHVSSESGWDFLRFYIDGVQKGQWSGAVAWQTVSYPVTAGTHTFLWQYSKDGNTSTGSDAAWIDSVILPSSSGPTPLSACTAISPAAPSVTLGSASPLLTATCTNSPTSYVWKLNGSTLGGCTGATCTVPAANLPTATTYGVTVTANNAGGTGTTAASATITVSTTPAPTVVTNAATNITTSGGTMNGSANPNGTSTNGYFQWGTSTAYGNTTASTALGSGNSSTPFAINLINAPANTTYYYRAVATSSAGISYGNGVSFVTGTSGCSEIEPNDGSLSANPLSLNVPCNGKLSSSTDVDWFDVYVPSGTTISFSLSVRVNAKVS